MYLIKKHLNNILAKFELNYSSRTRLAAYPTKMTICPGNICNLSCSLCPGGTKAAGRPRGFMQWDVFKKLIDECGPFLRKTDLYNWGEPLLNQEIFRMVSLLRQYRVYVNISSNMQHTNPDFNQELIKTDLNHLIVSLDGTTQESAEKYQRGIKIERSFENIRHIIKLKSELKSRNPVITWRFLITRYNEHELEQARKLSKEIGIDHFSADFLRCDPGNELLWNEEKQFESVNEWLPENPDLSMYDYNNKGRKKHTSKCKFLWIQPTVNWDGSVAPCCAVWHKKFDFGELCNSSSFFEIWNNDQFQTARGLFLDNSSSTTSTDNICSICKNNNAVI